MSERVLAMAHWFRGAVWPSGDDPLSLRWYWLLPVLVAAQVGVVYFGAGADLDTIGTAAGIVIGLLALAVLPAAPEVGLTLLIATTGLDFLGRLDPRPKYEAAVTFFHAALVITVVATVIHLLLKKRLRIPRTDFALPLMVFIGLITLSLLYTPNFYEGALELARLVALSSLFFVCLVVVTDRWKVKWVIVSLIVCAFGVSVLPIYQVFTEALFLPTQVISRLGGGTIPRSEGTFTNPNTLAAFLQIGIVLAVALLLGAKLSWKMRIVLVAGLGVTIFAMLTSFSRGGWVSSACGVLFLLIVRGKLRHVLVTTAVLLLGILLSYQFVPFVDVIASRIASILDVFADPSSSSRLYLMSSGWWMFLDNPVFGVGFRGYPELYYDYIHPDMPKLLRDVDESHTMPTTILAELGLVGFIVSMWLWLVVYREGMRAVRAARDPLMHAFASGLLALYVAFLVNFLFADDLVNNIFWLTMGMIYAVRLIVDGYWEEPAEEGLSPPG